MKTTATLLTANNLQHYIERLASPADNVHSSVKYIKYAMDEGRTIKVVEAWQDDEENEMFIQQALSVVASDISNLSDRSVIITIMCPDEGSLLMDEIQPIHDFADYYEVENLKFFFKETKESEKLAMAIIIA